MKYLLLIVLVWFCSPPIFAYTSMDCNKVLAAFYESAHFKKDIVDIHGVEGERAHSLLSKYKQTIQGLEIAIMSEFFDMNQGHLHPYRYECLMEKKKQWLEKIKQEEHFGFVDLQTVYYPKNKNLYTTFEVIPETNSIRMRFVPNESATWLQNVKNNLFSYKQKWSHTKDVIEDMQAFDRLATQLLLSNQLDPTVNDCPAYHCVVSFKHSQLQRYLLVFQQAAIKDKTYIIQTLRDDPDPARRAAAAFVIGHFTNPEEIISILSRSIDDSASQVRNNVLRVIMTTLNKSKLRNIDCQPFINLLDSPYVTDRNKALTILVSLSDDNLCKAQVLNYGIPSIKKLAQSTQLNNRNSARLLLKKLKHSSIS